jgi:hypothetical protein
MGVLVVLALALPAAASAQFMDPVLEQYAPSTEQIDKKVKEGADGQGKDDAEADPGAPSVSDDGEVADGDGNAAAGGAAGGSGGGGEGSGGGGGAAGAPGGGGDGVTAPSTAGDAGLDARLLGDVPVTWFDFLAFALATAALAGTALVLRRLSRSPRVEG